MIGCKCDGGCEKALKCPDCDSELIKTWVKDEVGYLSVWLCACVVPDEMIEELEDLRE